MNKLHEMALSSKLQPLFTFAGKEGATETDLGNPDLAVFNYKRNNA